MEGKKKKNSPRTLTHTKTIRAHVFECRSCHVVSLIDVAVMFLSLTVKVVMLLSFTAVVVLRVFPHPPHTIINGFFPFVIAESWRFLAEGSKVRHY